MKLKMFGKKSVSSFLFWLFVMCLVFLFVNFLLFLPDLVQNDNFPVLINIIPLIGGLIILFPLTLIFNSFRKNVIFTIQSIKYLNLFALCNIFVIPINILAAYSLAEISGQPLVNDNVLLSLIQVFGLNILLAIFALFIAAIFKQGFQVQQENDLTI
jgi:hypothetical protein